MLTSTFVLSSMLLADTAAAHKEKGGEWDPAAQKALEAKVRTMFTDLDAGNTSAIMAWADQPAITFDSGFDGKPLVANTREESAKMIEGYATWMKEEGATVKTTVHRADCHSTSNFGFCVLEFDQAATVKGESMPVGKYRATLIARTVDGSWKWSHWHASAREAMPHAAPSP